MKIDKQNQRLVNVVVTPAGLRKVVISSVKTKIFTAIEGLYGTFDFIQVF